MNTASSLLITIFAACCHLGAVFLGYRFHLWMLEEETDTSSFASSIKKHPRRTTSTTCSQNDAHSSSRSKPRFAFGQTLALWILVVGLVARCRQDLLLIFFVGLVLLLQFVPRGGQLADDQLKLAVWAYLSWLAILATTTATLLWPCHTHFGFHVEGHEGATYYRPVAIGGACTAVVAGAMAISAYLSQQEKAAQAAKAEPESGTFNALY